MSERNEGAEKPPSLRIKTKAGEVIDISLLAMQGLPADIDRLGPIAAGLIDALEAALSVPVRGGMTRAIEMAASREYLDGWNECRAEQRRRAGVIEEPA